MHVRAVAGADLELLRVGSNQRRSGRHQQQGAGRDQASVWDQIGRHAMDAAHSGSEPGRRNRGPDHRKHTRPGPRVPGRFLNVLHLKTEEPKKAGFMGHSTEPGQLGDGASAAETAPPESSSQSAHRLRSRSPSRCQQLLECLGLRPCVSKGIVIGRLRGLEFGRMRLDFVSAQRQPVKPM